MSRKTLWVVTGAVLVCVVTGCTSTGGTWEPSGVPLASPEVLRSIAATAPVSPQCWHYCRETTAMLTAAEKIEQGGVTFTLAYGERWPNDLLAAAKVYVAANSGFASMTLSRLEIAEESDGTQWAVFLAGVTDWPEYERAAVALRKPAGGEWRGVNLGTGAIRSEVLPAELVAAGFGSGVYPD